MYMQINLSAELGLRQWSGLSGNDEKLLYSGGQIAVALLSHIYFLLLGVEIYDTRNIKSAMWQANAFIRGGSSSSSVPETVSSRVCINHIWEIWWETRAADGGWF